MKFFRTLRKRLLAENKTNRYLLYALGEILLVVVGILIALQINNWNEDRNDRFAERRYVNDLIEDLKNDSIMLHDIYTFLESKSRSKEKIAPILRGERVAIDSMPHHFNMQWAVQDRFTPTTITIEELKNDGKLNIIRDTGLRRKIVSLYNHYSKEEFAEDMFNQQNFNLMGVASNYFGNLLEPKPAELSEALQNKAFVNGIIANFTFARKDAIDQLQKQCASLIKELEAYRARINR
jgi:hypothetical protein